ncbi:ribosomal lysine N-methyltransferase [Podospora aff. communis PSN243]|uniref:Ribosomal lysine N-methyltransferase n=1 Tax=Podospora aff. communis PSN243 TaxID=3040156 RepID=A0AAV9G5G9_9PEZI|nr:ribosomal lysine N-methyltransferase [Podospora aff. communis PSN243]
MEIDGGHDVDFAKQTQSFLEWFKSLPGATFHKDIELVDMRGSGAGRGIIATADIAPDTVLFTIPRAGILCASTSPLAAQLPAIFNQDDAASDSAENEDDDDNSQDSWTLLILILIREYLDPNSKWKPYLSILPSTFTTPMFWPPTLLSHLQSSSILPKIGHASATAMIQSRILPIIASHPTLFFPPGSTPLPEADLTTLAHRCGSAIMAYAFDLETDDQDPPQDQDDDEWIEDRDGKTMLGMVPMADMLNADAEFNAHINHGEEALTATSLRAIKKGEEILNYYGPLGNGELLRRYGYVTAKHAQYDVVEVPWGLVEGRLRARFAGLSGEQWEAVRGYVKEQEEEEEEEEGEAEDAFVLEREGEDPDAEGRLHGEATFVGLPEELAERVKVFLKGVKKVAGAEGELLADKAVRKEIYLDCVLGALQDRERQYVTTLEDDEKLMRPERPVEREEMALWVRVGEKRLLREAQSWVSRELEAARREVSSKRERGDEDAPAAKRRRA